MHTTQQATTKKGTRVVYQHLIRFAMAFFIVVSVLGVGLFLFEQRYAGKIYPNVSIDAMSFTGATRQQVQEFWESRNVPFDQTTIELQFENITATLSADMLAIGYDATLSATQAYAAGRSGHIFSDALIKFFGKKVNLTPYFRWNESALDETLTYFAAAIDSPPENALFSFSDGKVAEFRPSKNGRIVDKGEAKRQFDLAIRSIPGNGSNKLSLTVPVVVVTADITTESVNTLGIKELIGTGYSEFSGSIPGRIHNVILAASRINGILVPPGETFSFNDAIGDISAATGYQSAYIIKDGRTVLGDGGGVCQVSSTIFRTALATGLPITERQAHAYRVHYYEDGGFKAGLDATVFGPTVDLKFTNNTPSHILIQSKADAKKLTLTIDFYGTSDGRRAEIINHVVGSSIAPPPPLYQDDPTLAPGVVKQVDFAAWGAKASFGYRVTRGDELLEDKTFISNYRPWQAIYLRGPQI